MTTNKFPVSSLQNIFHDAQEIDDKDLTLEQEYNSTIQSGIIQNHFGTGVLPETVNKVKLFDSLLTNGVLDGIAVYSQFQPSDATFGNQLEVNLMDSKAAGRRAVKIALIGLDFNGDLQFETFVFHRNERQVSSKHFSKLLLLLFNDFLGNSTYSMNLGGRVTIYETEPFTLSRDCLMVSQDTQPNLFFRDFFVIGGSGTLQGLLQSALPGYNIDTLGITTGYKYLRNIDASDVTTQVGQKFLAATNNIQKITLLMAVENTTDPNNLVWSGDLVISIYPLQSVVTSKTDLVPDLAIDFDPANVPLAQISFNYTTLTSSGIVLTGVPQPVDFVFSNTSVATGTTILQDNYYVVTAKRSGSSSQCNLQFAVGNNLIDNTHHTVFNGSVWVDIPEDDMWFQVWTDAAKVSDGQAYDSGKGVILEKINNNLDTSGLNSALQVDYVKNHISFYGNNLFNGVVQAVVNESVLTQDERTGEEIFSRKEYVPNINLISTTDLNVLKGSTDPLVIGAIADNNLKAIDLSDTTIVSKFHAFSFIRNECLIKVIEDSSDPRYDASIITLLSQIANGDLNGAKFVPNTLHCSTNVYKIASAQVCSMILGDVNNDGIIDANDLSEASALLNNNLSLGPTSAQYQALTNPFIAESGLSFQLKNVDTSTVIGTGTDGVLSVNPFDGSIASFVSSSTNFTTLLVGVVNAVIIITGATNLPNNGTVPVTGNSSTHTVTIKKTIVTSDLLMKILRADINGNFAISSADINLLSDYVNKVSPFPPTSSPSNKIGKPFKVIKIILESLVERDDDYVTLTPRSTFIHPNPDIFLDDVAAAITLFPSFESNNFLTSPIEFNIIKQLVWDDYFVVTNSKARQVPTIFESNTLPPPVCSPQGMICEPPLPMHDPGQNNFYIPGDLILGGNIISTDDNLPFKKIDIEIGTLVLEIPAINFPTEKSINIFTGFIADKGDGLTLLGYQPMKFVDCTNVKLDALSKNQLRFSVAAQAFSPLLDGDDPSDLLGTIVDGKIGVYMDYSSGNLTLNFSNLYQDPTLLTLKTKIQVQVFIKKSGFINPVTVLTADMMKTIFGL